ncbi:cobalbumin biosynthesis protein [Caldalkalibacillus thermarum TA2.A1]|uniref:Adenosylcobinamide kinase n=1 Tax=Caldalkalibacillus thermarum (strain TA2.A1) TaxID=986075 RepID=F5LAV9_CALTT|nr:bifunctional adenosylcobinamide kinase/adenosylcobinamide-phosphate guanylyltransferase [Caldalkalibacillus thermarum]EGL81498.1 cobalbumin biosynthesis protein [Caldalkalibacillus thermarum TA2.A1]QZT33800.1 bifunctional adenosylcobinamide kinase/adenosylcobinamide-phosphate guanylyltransferase [Caldalkalibacillus thermarum TA2.A1]
MIIFISGGARSGKSSYAESLCMQLARPGTPLIYLATARPLDAEMKQRIRRHRQGRARCWQTIEDGKDLNRVLKHCARGSIVLVDCLTIWLSFLLFEEGLPVVHILAKARRMLATARQKQLTLVLVSNDVNEGIPPADHEVARYIYALERLHRLCVAEADHAIQVVAGQVLSWKGEQRWTGSEA